MPPAQANSPGQVKRPAPQSMLQQTSACWKGDLLGFSFARGISASSIRSSAASVRAASSIPLSSTTGVTGDFVLSLRGACSSVLCLRRVCDPHTVWPAGCQTSRRSFARLQEVLQPIHTRSPTRDNNVMRMLLDGHGAAFFQPFLRDPPRAAAIVRGHFPDVTAPSTSATAD